MSTKFQITFPDPLMARVKVASRRKKISMAEYVREATEESLRRERRSGANASHPLAGIIGLVDTDQTDLASRVDEIYD